MLEHCKDARERWGGVSDLIDRWLKERQDVLVRYCELSAENDYSKTESLQPKLVLLCEMLMDYVSAGHFEIYEQLAREAREFNDGDSLELAAKVYPRITETTQVILDFNDKIDGRDISESEMQTLFAELSRVGEILVSRFELEDLLIAHLHTANADKVEPA